MSGHTPSELHPSLVGKIVAAMAERSKKAAYFVKGECQSDLDAVKAWADSRQRIAAANEAKIEALTKALSDAQKAISTLNVDALGYGEDDAGRWPLRDELLQAIDAALASTEAMKGQGNG